MKKRALLAFDDPGGGLAVCSLIQELKKNDLNLEIYSGKLSEKIVKAITNNFYHIDSDITRKDADRILDNYMPHILITATGGGNAEQLLRNSAREKKIRSVVILDFWKDYKRRWKFADYPLSAMKDKVCVMDELTKQEMIEEGFPTENLFVTGHPYLDKIFSNGNERFSKVISAENEVSILFLSQPLRILGVMEYKIHPLKVFLGAVMNIIETSGKKFKVKIKLHPSEIQSDEIDKIIADFHSGNFALQYAPADLNVNELIKANDIVAGYNTIAMFEARAAGKRTLSLEIGKMNASLRNSMMLAGIEVVKCDTNEISEALAAEKKSQIANDVFRGGVSNCVEVIMNQFDLF